jgi:hypothetical protein
VETFWSPHSHIRSILRLDGDIPTMETLRGNTVTQFNVKVLRQDSGIHTVGI